MQGVQGKLRYPLTMRVIPERLRDASCGGAIQIDITFTLTFTYWLIQLQTDRQTELPASEVDTSTNDESTTEHKHSAQQ